MADHVSEIKIISGSSSKHVEQEVKKYLEEKRPVNPVSIQFSTAAVNATDIKYSVMIVLP